MASKADDSMPSQHATLEAHYGSLGPADIPNPSAKNVSFYTPAQVPPAGSAFDPQHDGAAIPKLFHPLKIRGVTLPNRILLSPLCQYSCDFGHMTPWHMAHLGGIASRGPGMTMVEATAVQANGRITPEDSGLWLDSQIAPLARVVEFVHSQNQVIGIQLGHAGRKASTVAPWIDGRAVASEKVGGWPDDVVAPSAISWGTGLPEHPKALSLADIETLKKDFVSSVQRALKAGVDLIEIHSAHGYLYHEFLSPVSNQRTDQYGGSFENRVRLLVETATLVRSTIPKDMPLFVRVSGSDYLEESRPDLASWRVEDTAKLAVLLADVGVDLVDVSGGGNHPEQHPHAGPAYQAPMALAAKKAVGDRMLISTVGSVSDGKVAQECMDKGLDAVFVGRGFQKNPGTVWSYAEDLGVEIMMAHQIRWGFGGRGGAQKKK